MPAPRTPRKPKVTTARHLPQRDMALSTKWQNLVELLDIQGRPWRRFYKLETLSSAIDKMVREKDRFILPALEQVFGPGKVTQLVFTLAAEDALRLTFHVTATHVTRRRATVAMVVAKNAEEASRRVALEYKHLAILKERIPQQMAEPIRRGAIFIPDRYRRTEHHRDLEAYITLLPRGFEPLGIHRNGQFMTTGAAPHTFSKRETEALKCGMIEIIVSAFHPLKRDGIDTHQLDPSSFQVNRSGKGTPVLKLFNCVHMQTRLSPAKVLGFLLTDSWKSWGQESDYATEDPEQFYQAVSKAIGKDAARPWITQFIRLARERKVKGPAVEYLDGLEAACAEAD